MGKIEKKYYVKDTAVYAHGLSRVVCLCADSLAAQIVADDLNTALDLQHRNKALVDSLTEIAYHTSEGEALQQKDFMALCQDIHESASAALAANGDADV